jgi:hypothetical protein
MKALRAQRTAAAVRAGALTALAAPHPAARAVRGPRGCLPGPPRSHASPAPAPRPRPPRCRSRGAIAAAPRRVRVQPCPTSPAGATVRAAAAAAAPAAPAGACDCAPVAKLPNWQQALAELGACASVHGDSDTPTRLLIRPPRARARARRPRRTRGACRPLPVPGPGRRRCRSHQLTHTHLPTARAQTRRRAGRSPSCRSRPPCAWPSRRRWAWRLARSRSGN